MEFADELWVPKTLHEFEIELMEVLLYGVLVLHTVESSTGVCHKWVEIVITF